ncbi:tail fiber assembly protein [Methylobacterium oryzihabitans]|uniref:tail fiber assembly protein n=1 Tax=Methylobacterium oryzihabitans TaxID=2499852 RepID=UPI001FEB8465|nr:tail fiber assembly protein [Methylobacterium oryzihabitans]
MSQTHARTPVRGPTPRPAHSGHARLARGLGWFSIGLGLAELIAPRALCRAIGLPGRETLVQAYGAREVATGIAILASHDPTPWIWGRVGGDALDLATLATGYEHDNPRIGGLALATAAVVGVTLADVACVQGLTADKRLPPPGRFDYADRSGFPRPVDAMRGQAADFAVPADFRIPEPLRPWTSGAPASGRSGVPA